MKVTDITIWQIIFLSHPSNLINHLERPPLPLKMFLTTNILSVLEDLNEYEQLVVYTSALLYETDKTYCLNTDHTLNITEFPKKHILTGHEMLYTRHNIIFCSDAHINDTPAFNYASKRYVHVNSSNLLPEVENALATQVGEISSIIHLTKYVNNQFSIVELKEQSNSLNGYSEQFTATHSILTQFKEIIHIYSNLFINKRLRNLENETIVNKVLTDFEMIADTLHRTYELQYSQNFQVLNESINSFFQILVKYLIIKEENSYAKESNNLVINHIFYLYNLFFKRFIIEEVDNEFLELLNTSSEAEDLNRIIKDILKQTLPRMYYQTILFYDEEKNEEFNEIFTINGYFTIAPKNESIQVENITPRYMETFNMFFEIKLAKAYYNKVNNTGTFEPLAPSMEESIIYENNNCIVKLDTTKITKIECISQECIVSENLTLNENEEIDFIESIEIEKIKGSYFIAFKNNNKIIVLNDFHTAYFDHVTADSEIHEYDEILSENAEDCTVDQIQINNKCVNVFEKEFLLNEYTYQQTDGKLLLKSHNDAIEISGCFKEDIYEHSVQHYLITYSYYFNLSKIDAEARCPQESNEKTAKELIQLNNKENNEVKYVISSEMNNFYKNIDNIPNNNVILDLKQLKIVDEELFILEIVNDKYINTFKLNMNMEIVNSSEHNFSEILQEETAKTLTYNFTGDEEKLLKEEYEKMENDVNIEEVLLLVFYITCIFMIIMFILVHTYLKKKYKYRLVENNLLEKINADENELSVETTQKEEINNIDDISDEQFKELECKDNILKLDSLVKRHENNDRVSDESDKMLINSNYFTDNPSNFKLTEEVY